MSKLLSSLSTKERLWANRSCHSLQKATVSKSLLALFTKERLWANRSCHSLRKSDTSESLFKKEQPEWLALNKRDMCSKKFAFSPCFWQFFTDFPLFMAKSKLLRSSFIKSYRSESLSLLFTKEWTWANRYFILLLSKNAQKTKEQSPNTGTITE